MMSGPSPFSLTSGAETQTWIRLWSEVKFKPQITQVPRQGNIEGHDKVKLCQPIHGPRELHPGVGTELG